MTLTDEQIRQKFFDIYPTDAIKQRLFDSAKVKNGLAFPTVVETRLEAFAEGFKAALSLQSEAVPVGYIREDNFLLGDVIEQQVLTRDKVEADDVPLYSSSPLHTDEQSDLQELETEYELWQDDVCVAMTCGNGALDEIKHYASQYLADGAVEIYEVHKTKKLLALLPEEGK